MFPIEALHTGLFVAIAIACVALWNQVFLFRSAGREIVALEPRRLVPWGGRDVGFVAIAAFALQALCAAPVLWSQQETAHPVAAAEGESVAGEETAETAENSAAPQTEQIFSLIIASSIGNLLALGGAIGWLRWRGATWTDLGLCTSQLGRDGKLGVAGFALISIPMFVLQLILIQFIPAEHPVSEVLEARPNMAVVILTAIMVVFVAPLTEEFFFRGVLQGWLESLYAARNRLRAPLPGPDAAATGEDPVVANSESTVDRATDAAEHTEQDPQPAPVSTVGEASAVEGTADVPAEQWTVNSAHRLRAEDAPLAEREISFMPILLSSMVFGMVHLGNGPSPIPLFFFALVLGYLYRQTHRLWPSVVAHATLNALSTLMLATGGGQ